MKYLLFVISVLLLAACSQNALPKTLKDPSPIQQIPASSAGLTLELEDDSFSRSPSAIEASMKNDSLKHYDYGDYFYIEVKKEDGWYILTHSDAVFIENPHLTDFGHVLLSGSRIKQSFSFDLLKVTLPAGEYRLIKTFLSKEQPFHEISLSAPFTVS
ncbi:immunoglobulin-like domain-containing protein [Planomicrobium sp. MB-3u-38]|uniref:immunoglobulin-like domain-containing protein n=1 Tax=Planomicrobium sp. MB-3u-38 TaxID=2058318 RepID=UPI000C7E564E|nr:immunoglobulin-like domain-containing protein [Planomicrobium sp. MB-3u-38]PKH08625.1 hypothetical protein CXF70_16045 [Planomicrobium sp. MB-3u-38]